MWWGLPPGTAADRVYSWGSDELGPLGPAAELYNVFFGRRVPYNPQYPLLQYFLQALAVGPYLFWLWLTGGLRDPATTFPFGLADPQAALAAMTLLCRLPSLLMGAAIPVIALRTAGILWDRKAGRIAGALAAVSYPAFYYARTSNVDLPALFWTSLGLGVYAACLRGSISTRRLIWMGVFAALATATKDPSYGAFLPAGAVLAAIHWRTQARAAWKPLLAACGAAVAVYLVASGLVFNWDRYWQHLLFITHGSDRYPGFWYYSSPATLAGYASLLGTTLGRLVDSLGLPQMLAAAAGLVLCWRRERRLLWWALPAAGVLLLVVAPVRFVLFRHVMVIAYVLSLLAAYGLSRIPKPGVAGLGCMLVCGWCLIRGADLTWQMLRDPRYEAAAWLSRNVRAGDRVAYFGKDDTWKLPALPPQARWIEGIEQRPEFVLLIPNQDFESEHEVSVSAQTYAALNDGSLGYQKVLEIQTASLFASRPVSFVNPPVKVYARKNRR